MAGKAGIAHFRSYGSSSGIGWDLQRYHDGQTIAATSASAAAWRVCVCVANC